MEYSVMSHFGTTDFMLEVAKGKIPGHSQMNKFGENQDIDTGTDPEDVWDYGGLYIFSTTADIDSMSCATGDTVEMTVIGLDSNWDEVAQTKTLTGQTTVTLDTPLIRVYRAYNSSGTDLTGDVYIYINGASVAAGVPTVAAEVRAQVTAAAQQTLMCIYTVPADHTAFFISGYVAYAKSSSTGANFSWKARAFGGVFQTKSVIALIGTGSSVWNYHYGVPLALPEKTDIKITCDEVEANNTSVSGGFDLILVENTFLT